MNRQFLRAIPAGLTLLALMASPATVLAETTFVAIDLISHAVAGKSTSPSAAAQVAGHTPVILARVSGGDPFVRALTLDDNATRLGGIADIVWPPNPCAVAPSRIMKSDLFLPGELIVLSQDLAISHVPLSFLPDGTPEPGAWTCYPPDPGAEGQGAGTAITELTGSEFRDGQPRLVVGTDMGMVMVYVKPVGGGLVLENVLDVLQGSPIAALKPIPQLGKIVIGAATGMQVVGLSDLLGQGMVEFSLQNPSDLPVVDFDVFGPTDVAIGDPGIKVYIAFCDGLNNQTEIAELPAVQMGSGVLNVRPPGPPNLPVIPVQLALGSLLILGDDGASVYFDPGYDETNGSSGCVVNVVDEVLDNCAACAVAATGDVNVSGAINSSDIIALVNFVFKGGAAPLPCQAAGDVNCSGQVHSADIITLVNYVFKGGASPCDVCTLIPGVWACP